jgi:ATP-dependent Clp protease protease subunit
MYQANNFVPSIEIRDGNRTVYMDPVSLLFKRRIILVGLPVTDEYVNVSIIPSLLFLDQEDEKPITMYINSPGGSITAGQAVIDTMDFIKSPVHTVCVGQCASMAAVILACGVKGHRGALRSSRILIHQPWMGGAGGQQSDVELQAKELKRMRESIEERLASQTGQTIAKIHTDCERDYIMTADEALTYGIVDKVVTKRSAIK